MSRYELVLIGTDDPFDEVAATIARVLDTSADHLDDDSVYFGLSQTARMWLDPDELDMPVKDDPPEAADTRFGLRVQDLADDVPPADDYAAQEATARQVFAALADATSWNLVLMGPCM